METLLLIIKITGILAGIVLLLTILSSGDTVREILAGPFRVLLALPTFLRDGSLRVIQGTYSFMTRSAQSVGLTGEHGIQRIAGALLLSICSVAGILVSFAILLVTFQSIFGVNTTSIMESLPLSTEELMAIDLVIAAVIFPLLLFDTLGMTHTTKYFSPENLGRIKKYFFIILFIIGALATILFLGWGGLLRYQAIKAMEVQDASAEELITEPADLYTPLVAIPASANPEKMASDTEQVSHYNTEEVDNAASYNNSLKAVMVGVPVISAFAAGPSFVGALPMIAMLVKLFLLCLVIVPAGIIWMISHGVVSLLNNVYGWIMSFFDIFIRTGDRIRQLFTPGQNSNSMAQNTVQAETRQEIYRPDGSQVEIQNVNPAEVEPQASEEEPLYKTGDANWNPLA